MRKYLLGILLCAGLGSVYASPLESDNQIDPLLTLLQERGMLQQLSTTVGQGVAHTAHQVAGNTSQLVKTAMGFIGVPYRRGGSSAESGFDCSGFVRAIYQKAVGHVLPRRADAQAAATTKIDRRELKPGDLVFFNTMRRAYSHVGIYVGEGRFIHAPRSGAKVRVESMESSYWQTRFNGARRVAFEDSRNHNISPYSLTSFSISSPND